MLTLSIGATAQKFKVLEGDIKPLKSETSINTKFVYEGITIGKKEQKEADYIASKKAEYNSKTPGKGDNWAKSWIDDREEKYEPRFNNEFSKVSGMTVTPNAKYTMIVKTRNIEPGYNVGVMAHSAELDAEIWVVETANPSNVLAKISITKSPGQLFGADFDTGIRITECYATCAKKLAREIK